MRRSFSFNPRHSAAGSDDDRPHPLHRRPEWNYNELGNRTNGIIVAFR